MLLSAGSADWITHTATRTFTYRNPRLDTVCDLTFLSGAAAPLYGHCINASEAGLRAGLCGNLPLGTAGSLHLQQGHHSITVPAILTHLQERQAVFAFTFENADQQNQMRRFLAHAALNAPRKNSH